MISNGLTRRRLKHMMWTIAGLIVFVTALANYKMLPAILEAFLLKPAMDIWAGVQSNRLEEKYYVFSILGSFGVIGALIFAAFQIRSQEKQMQASALMEIDKQYKSTEVLASRLEFNRIWRTVCSSLEINDAIQANPEVQKQFSRIVSDYLHIVQNSNANKYREIMGLCQFFEQVGYAARRGYLDIVDVLYLFATGLRDLDLFTRDHFANLRRVSPSVYEHTSWLMQQARKF